MLKTSAGFDGNQLFGRTRRAHAQRRRHGRAAEERADLENLSVADFGEMINEQEDIEMKHRIFRPDFVELPVDWPLPVVDERAHELKWELCSRGRSARNLTRLRSAQTV